MSYIINSLNGVSVTNTPTGPGQTLVSTSSTTAAWSSTPLGPLLLWLRRNNPGTGTTWNEIQSSYNATLNSITWDPQGVIFAGSTSSYGSGTGSSLPQGATPRTMAVRFNPVSLAGVIFAYGTSTTNQAQGIALLATGIRYFGGSNDYDVTVTIPTSAWSVISVSYDGTNAKVYFNGVPIGTSARTWNTTGTTYYVGRNISVSSAFNGTVSDALVYSAALSDVGHAQLAQMLL